MIDIYTDGSYKPKTNKGGYACIIIKNNNIINILYQGYINTTNNRQELFGVLNGLLFFKTPQNINLYCDSNYIVNTINNNYLKSWIDNHKDKKNIDLWKEIYKLINFHNVNFIWVKGHDKCKYNKLADLYAHISSIVLNPIKDL